MLNCNKGNANCIVFSRLFGTDFLDFSEKSVEKDFTLNENPDYIFRYIYFCKNHNDSIKE